MVKGAGSPKKPMGTQSNTFYHSFFCSARPFRQDLKIFFAKMGFGGYYSGYPSKPIVIHGYIYNLILKYYL